MNELREWQHTLADAVNDFFMVLAEGDTPEAWGECPIDAGDEPAGD